MQLNTIKIQMLPKSTPFLYFWVMAAAYWRCLGSCSGFNNWTNGHCLIFFCAVTVNQQFFSCSSNLHYFDEWP